MRNRIISIFIVGILVCSVCGCVKTDEGTFTEIAVYAVENEQGEKETESMPNTSEPEKQLMSQEGAPIELFNSQGVYIRLLAEGDEELSESERVEFLAAFGFEDSEPFYVHTEDDGYPFMELYFDEDREIGCGIRYGENRSGNVICGFAFENCQEVSWHARDPFSVLSVYGTTYSSQYSYFDESGRVAHTSSYITHGSLEGYYIYQGDSDVPVYYLELDHQYTSWPTFYRFVNKVHNWEFGDEADFLAAQGFTEDDLFYEYEYAGAPDILFRLSLYCDEYVTRGVGFIREYENGEYKDLEIFTFDGCEQYLKDAAVGRFSVYSDYDTNGRETHFLEGETIDDYFRAMELDETHAVSFDYEDGLLVHMEQGLTHGSVDRFYFYRSGDYSYRCGPYMLEVDHGFGVSFYKF